MARTYRLVAVGVVTVNDDGSTGTAWANGGQHYQKLHSAVHTLAVRMASEGY